MKAFALMCCLVIGMAAPPLLAAEAPKLEMKDGDRIAFIGNTFVEREAVDCYIETMLLTRYPDRHITFRNLGYSGDTADGSARGLCLGGSFEGPDKAFERLRKLVTEWKPTVLLINYGMTESFDGPEKLDEFTAKYNKMLDALIAASDPSPRVVLLSPNYHEDLGRPLPDPAAHNKSLRLYSDAIGAIAAKRGFLYVDLFALTERAAKAPPAAPLTWNGIHLTPYGYWRVALALKESLGYADDAAEMIDVDPSATAAKLNSHVRGLCSPPPPGDAPKSILDGSVVIPGEPVTISASVKSGTYELNFAGKPLAKASAEQWSGGVAILNGPEAQRVEAVRKIIVAKDFDYFNYQRPDNDSYILAFRKKEQGRNAAEIPQFLPLVAEKETQIADLLMAKQQPYTLQRVK